MYELALVLQSTNKTDEEVKKEFDQFRRNLEAALKDDFGVQSVHHWGRRKFVFPIKKQEYGYYVLMAINTSGAGVDLLIKELQHQDLVLRYQLLELPEGASTKPQSDIQE